MKRKLIYFIALLLLMFITGIYVGVSLTLIQSLQGFTTEEFIHIVEVIVSNVALPMRILIPICLFFMLLCLWFYRYKRSTGFYLGLSALFLLIITLLLTLLVLDPIGNTIIEWTLTPLTSNWENFRNKWQFFHGLCSITSLLCYGCFAWFILAAMRKNKIANY